MPRHLPAPPVQAESIAQKKDRPIALETANWAGSTRRREGGRGLGHEPGLIGENVGIAQHGIHVAEFTFEWGESFEHGVHLRSVWGSHAAGPSGGEPSVRGSQYGSSRLTKRAGDTSASATATTGARMLR